MTRAKNSMTREEALRCANDVFRYEPDTGHLIRISASKYNKRGEGKRAGNKNTTGYRMVRLMGLLFCEHRVIWFMVYGEIPESVDHINGVRDDNKLSNLRKATKAENSRNMGLTRNNRSGFKGVWIDKKSQKYTSRITAKGIGEYLGLFDTAEQAHAAYCEAAKKYHGEFARTK